MEHVESRVATDLTNPFTGSNKFSLNSCSPLKPWCKSARTSNRIPMLIGFRPHRYNAKVHPHLPKLKSLLQGMSERLDQRPDVIVVPHPSYKGDRNEWDSAWMGWDDFVRIGRAKKLGRTTEGEIEWTRMDFDWPLWILFSSGTTGM